jgi:hypothetical protein
MSKNKEELRDRINKTVHKNCLKGLWVGLKKLEVKDCKIGDIVLTFSGSVFEISEISRNKKRENDLTIAVGVGDIAGSMYGSYEGVFPSLYKLEQV